MRLHEKIRMRTPSSRIFLDSAISQSSGRAIQGSRESLRALAKRYGVNQKTSQVKRRGSVADMRVGPMQPRSTVLSGQEEAIVVAFRRHTVSSA